MELNRVLNRRLFFPWIHRHSAAKKPSCSRDPPRRPFLVVPPESSVLTATPIKGAHQVVVLDRGGLLREGGVVWGHMYVQLNIQPSEDKTRVRLSRQEVAAVLNRPGRAVWGLPNSSRS